MAKSMTPLQVIRQMQGEVARENCPWFLRCKTCKGTGEKTPPRAEWDLLPPHCPNCAGSGRIKIPMAEVMPDGREDNIDGQLPPFVFPEVRFVNRKGRKAARKKK